MRTVLFLILAATAFAQESANENYVETLRSIAEEGGRLVLETLSKIESAPRDFENMTAERMESLLWEHQVQKAATERGVKEAVVKGMLKNKVYTNFQCVSDRSQETFHKLDEIESKILETSQKIMKKGLTLIKPFGLIMPAFYHYIQDLFEKKTEDLTNTDNPESQRKILKEVEEKMKLLKFILKQVDDRIFSLKYKFLEEHIDFTYQTEENFRKVQREGAGKINKCVN